MRNAVRANPNRIPRGRTTTIPAPVKGWYAQESLIDADTQSASQLDNFFPEPTTIRARRGKTLHVSGLGGRVESLLPYINADTTAKLFAAAGSKLWDVTDDATIDIGSDTPEIADLLNARFQHTMFSTAGGQFLYIVNGDDPAQHFNGTVWTEPAIAGVNSEDLIHICAHKSRLWFVEKNSTNIWYLDTDSIAGTANIFPVGGLLAEGGYPMAIGTWSPSDSGDGMDDLLIVVSSQGEILVYGGDDPAVDFFLLQKYRTGDPIGRRCLFKIGGDLLILTELGLMPLSALARLDVAASESKALSRNIRKAYADAVQNSRDTFGWQMVSHPLRNMGILNIPASGAQETVQFAINTITGAWSRFRGWNACCWAHFNAHPLTDELFFGDTDGNIWHADSGGDDGGDAITCVCVSAFSDLGLPGRLKHVVAARPIIQSDIDQTPSISIAVDYQVPQEGHPGSVTTGDWFTWDVSVWDGPDVWRGELILRSWLGVGNIGTAIAPVMRIDIDASNVGSQFEYRLIGYDMIFEPGGVI